MEATITQHVTEAAPTPNDERNRAILRQRAAARIDDRPRVGDFVIYPDHPVRGQPDRWGHCFTAPVERISYDYEPCGLGAEVQTSPGGSFYLSDYGASFSGGLNPAIPKGALTDTGEMRLGTFWFFHHDFAAAHAGVECLAPCRVWRYNPA